jgi:hypothetical protein
MIGNIDESPLTFDPTSWTTLNEKGAKTVPIKTTVNEKNHLLLSSVAWLAEPNFRL